MTKKKIVAGDCLYHAVHGLCRIERIIKQKQSGKEVQSFSIVPKVSNRMRERFIIAVADLEMSGFHRLISLKEANDLLAYLKAGRSEAVPASIAPKAASSFFQENQTWGLVQTILVFSQDQFAPKDQRKRQTLERAAKGLVGELAIVFKLPLKETAAKIQSSFDGSAKVNPSIRLALSNAGED